MKDGLELLHDLQIKDDLLKEIDRIIKEIPERIKEIEQERDGKKIIIENSKKKLEINLKERKKFEGDILQIKDKISKYKDQMNKSTTNKEYQGFISEIKYEENKITKVEESIIEKMLESDDIMQEIRESEKEYEGIKFEYEKKISDHKSNLEYHINKKQKESKICDTLKVDIPKNLLKKYEALYKNKSGKAISSVETEFCGVCNVKLRPQLLSDLISTNNFITCENCGRILFKIIKEDEEENKQDS